MHGLTHQGFAQHGPGGGLPVPPAGEGRAARVLQGHVPSSPVPVDDLAEQQRAPVPDLRREAPELVTGVGLRERLGARRHPVPREDRSALRPPQQLRIQTQVPRVGVVELEQDGHERQSDGNFGLRVDPGHCWSEFV